MMRGATILWAILVVASGIGLFLLKYQVQAQELHLREVRKDIGEAEQSIHVLKAEWSYLNEPLRLREQAERHLGMHPMKASQIALIDSLPMAGEHGPTSVPSGEPSRQAAFPPAAPPARPSDPHPPTSPRGRPIPTNKPAVPGRAMTADKNGAISAQKVATAKPIAKSSAPLIAEPEVASSRVRP